MFIGVIRWLKKQQKPFLSQDEKDEKDEEDEDGILCILSILARTRVLGLQHGPVAVYTVLKRLPAGPWEGYLGKSNDWRRSQAIRASLVNLGRWGSTASTMAHPVRTLWAS